MSSFEEVGVEGFAYSFEAEPLFAEQSDFQLVEVFDTPAFGRLLALDGLAQTSEKDEFTYHEMLVHVPMLLLERPRKVLVIGGGDGGSLRRVLEHSSVERAVMVEIDGVVIDVSKRFLPSIAGDAWQDSRAEVIVGDGIAYLQGSEETFDVIIIDSSDPVGPGEGLFTSEFYASAKAHLATGGILCAQSGGVHFQQGELARAWKQIREVFEDVRCMIGDVPIYPGTRWSFVVAGCSELPELATIATRMSERDLDVRLITPELVLAAFALPKFVQDLLGGEKFDHLFGPSPEEATRAT